jgi:hypothetical protein
MVTQQAAYVPPVIPNKYEIIPIHNSDRGSFKRCRRYWNWSSPTRNNLMVRADVFGVNVPMWFGTGIHYSLESHYNPGLKRDPVEAWKTWFDIQWRGGIVTEEWLDRVYDLKPRLQAVSGDEPYASPTAPVEALYLVRGLEDILPDPDHIQFDELFEIGIGMLEYYKQYAEREDNFDVLMVEHDFSVPIWDYANNRILVAIDVREESPNCGKVLEVHARGRQDAILLRHGAERLGIMDHKTTKDNPLHTLETLLPKLDTDEQCTTYLYAAQIEASYYDLPHKGKPFEEVIYNVLRKAYPQQPTELKNGMFSVDRQNESTTYPLLMQWIARNMPGVPLNLKQQEYVNYLREAGDKQFIFRHLVRRNQHQLASAGQRLYLEALDILDPELRIYPNITNDWLCRGCQFRAPCMAKEDGSDWEQMIRDNYVVTRDR